MGSESPRRAWRPARTIFVVDILSTPAQAQAPSSIPAQRGVEHFPQSLEPPKHLGIGQLESPPTFVPAPILFALASLQRFPGNLVGLSWGMASAQHLSFGSFARLGSREEQPDPGAIVRVGTPRAPAVTPVLPMVGDPLPGALARDSIASRGIILSTQVSLHQIHQRYKVAGSRRSTPNPTQQAPHLPRDHSRPQPYLTTLHFQDACSPATGHYEPTPIRSDLQTTEGARGQTNTARPHQEKSTPIK
ncbi:hypothetical protein CRENBAI_026451 [Crenichthys baileyi]|uniref:Uncharacterized protein n=1 Tax=Crenichthys baileyi TaxID=28760 RepID=A0AAV9RC72_9TELE